jgi:hypothetical protein
MPARYSRIVQRWFVDSAESGIGEPLPPHVQKKMEAFFKADFSDVRIHPSSAVARLIGAHAFTSGTDIYFAPGQYHPDTLYGQQLLGHELAHVIQQRSGCMHVPALDENGLIVVDDPELEAQADQMGLLAAVFQLPADADLTVTSPARRSTLPAAARVIQCQYDRPTGGKNRQRWEKAEQRLIHLSPNGKEMWAEVVAAATDIESLEKFVELKLANRQAKLTAKDDERKQVGLEAHRRNVEAQKKVADAARERKEAQAEAARKQREENEARARAIKEASQEPKERRRMESFARLLESPDNVCVAIVKVGDKLYAATNAGTLSRVSYAEKTLGVERVDESTGVMGERTRMRDAQKVSHYVTEGGISATDIAGIEQVGADWGSVHAEMKILNWLFDERKEGTYEIYVSKLCCNNCRIAIDEWNLSSSRLKVNSPGGHGNYFLGWLFPRCISGLLRGRIEAQILSQESDTNPDSRDLRGRSRVRENKSQREVSVSPAPTSAGVRNL